MRLDADWAGYRALRGMAEATAESAPEAGGGARAGGVCLIHSEPLLALSDKNPRYTGRAKLVHSLIQAYGLLDHLTVVEPRTASLTELLSFHSASYLSFLRDHNGYSSEDDEEEEEEELEEYGLGYDCPLFSGVYDYVGAVGGASLAAAEAIVGGAVGVAINWYGGWHHAKRDMASGFCYVNDIAMAILRLLEHYPRVLYVDMDIHHGDGVEDAFSHSARVMTVSLHKYCPGFFPGSGGVASVGVGRGRFHSVNVPLSDGIRDDMYHALFSSVLTEARSKFNPPVVVLQCGADMLSGDPIGSFSLTPRGVGRCVGLVLDWAVPVLLLGGGGYHFANTARCWAHLTALAEGAGLPDDIPEHEGFEHYGPSYELNFDPGNRPNENTEKSMADLLQTISSHLANLPHS